MVRRNLVYVAAWFAAGVGAVALASVGVSMVGRQVTTADRPAPFSADEVRRELEAETAPTATTVPDGATTTTLPGDAATTTTTVAAPPTTAPSGSGGSATPPTTAPTSVPTAQPVLRTYTLVGGTVTLRFTADGATVEAPTPNPGFDVDVSPAHDNGVRVEFRNDSDGRRSRVEGWWDGGPQDEVEEEGESD